MGRSSGYRYLKVYYEDRDVMVVEKPSGLHAASPPGGKRVDTLLSEARAYLQRKFGSKGAFAGSLHRLDVETSGIMVLARSRAGEKLREAFKEHKIDRRYQALVAGRVEEDEGGCAAPIEKGEFGSGRKVRISVEGNPARTEFRVVERYRDATLLEVTMRTGRTHQIRVHMEKLGHPLLGDKVYGNAGKRFRRQALHASFIRFLHPTSGKRLEFRSPLPKDMEEIIDRLRGE